VGGGCLFLKDAGSQPCLPDGVVAFAAATFVYGCDSALVLCRGSLPYIAISAVKAQNRHTKILLRSTAEPLSREAYIPDNLHHGCSQSLLKINTHLHLQTTPPHHYTRVHTHVVLCLQIPSVPFSVLQPPCSVCRTEKLKLEEGVMPACGNGRELLLQVSGTSRGIWAGLCYCTPVFTAPSLK